MPSLSFAGQTCLGTVTPDSTVAPMRQEYHYGDRVTVTCDIGRRANTVSVQRLHTVLASPL